MNSGKLHRLTFYIRKNYSYSLSSWPWLSTFSFNHCQQPSFPTPVYFTHGYVYEISKHQLYNLPEAFPLGCSPCCWHTIHRGDTVLELISFTCRIYTCKSLRFWRSFYCWKCMHRVHWYFEPCVICVVQRCLPNYVRWKPSVLGLLLIFGVHVAADMPTRLSYMCFLDFFVQQDTINIPQCCVFQLKQHFFNLNRLANPFGFPKGFIYLHSPPKLVCIL